MTEARHEPALGNGGRLKPGKRHAPKARPIQGRSMTANWNSPQASPEAIEAAGIGHADAPFSAVFISIERNGHIANRLVGQGVETEVYREVISNFIFKRCMSVAISRWRSGGPHSVVATTLSPDAGMSILAMGYGRRKGKIAAVELCFRSRSPTALRARFNKLAQGWVTITRSPNILWSLQATRVQT